MVEGGEIQRWSTYLDQVAHLTNTREVRVHGCPPVELLLGYNPVIHHHEYTVRHRQAARHLQERQETWNNHNDTEFLRPQREVHLAGQDELPESTRRRYLTRFVLQQGKPLRYPAPKEEDLVFLRRAAPDNRYNKKLEARWEGPYRLGDIEHHGRSGRIYYFANGRLVKTKQVGLKDRIHLDHLQVYVSRDRSTKEDVGSVGRIKCAKVEWKGDGAQR